LGTALILAIVGQARDRDEQARAVASAEAHALQARMNPHFLFNALNALGALSKVAPREIPRATGQLRQFLRASFDQQGATARTGGRRAGCSTRFWTSSHYDSATG
jgi:LytS/YehU family sensor histidine kinase